MAVDYEHYSCYTISKRHKTFVAAYAVLPTLERSTSYAGLVKSFGQRRIEHFKDVTAAGKQAFLGDTRTFVYGPARVRSLQGSDALHSQKSLYGTDASCNITCGSAMSKTIILG
jgi:hypothetical protein